MFIIDHVTIPVEDEETSKAEPAQEDLRPVAPRVSERMCSRFL
jgi:hypothetical protein